MIETLRQICKVVTYRHLLWNLAVKDLKVKYRNPFLGFLWIILVPLFQICILKIVFSFIFRIPVEKYPFFIFLMTGLFPWFYFNSSIIQASESVVSNAPLIKKANFPREVIPLSIIISNLVHFILILLVMLIFLVIFKIKITALIFYLPLLLFFNTLICVGMALVVSSCHVLFRDTKYIVEILFMGWFYFSPILYPLSLVAGISDNLLRVYLLNPVAGLVTLYRLVLLGGYMDNVPSIINISYLILGCLISCLGVFLFGFWIFRKFEPKFFDLL